MSPPFVKTAEGAGPKKNTEMLTISLSRGEKLCQAEKPLKGTRTPPHQSHKKLPSSLFTGGPHEVEQHNGGGWAKKPHLGGFHRGTQSLETTTNLR